MGGHQERSPTMETIMRQAKSQISTDFAGKLEAARLSANKASASRDGLPKRGKGSARQPEDRERAERRKATLTNMLGSLAALGDKAAIERALEEGASLTLASARPKTPATEAILAGHGDLARWLMGRSDCSWATRGRPEAILEGCELNAALRSDDQQTLAWMIEQQPEMEDIWLLRRPRRFGERIVDVALSQAPRCAAWLIMRRPQWFESAIAETASALDRSPTTKASFDAAKIVRGLGIALDEADWASAAVIFEVLRPLLERGRGVGSPGLSAVGAEAIWSQIERDCPDGLAWLLAQSEKLASTAVSGGFPSGLAAVAMKAAAWARNVPGLNPEFAAWMGKPCKHPESLREPLMMWAALAGARACFKMLAELPEFQVPFAQEQDADSSHWELAYVAVRDPAMIKAMEAQGFSFSREAGPGWGYSAVFMGSGSMRLHEAPAGVTAEWLAWMGKNKPELMAGRPGDGKTPFELVAESAQEAKIGEVQRWMAIVEKAQMERAAGTAPAAQKAKKRL